MLVQFMHVGSGRYRGSIQSSYTSAAIESRIMGNLSTRFLARNNKWHRITWKKIDGMCSSSSSPYASHTWWTAGRCRLTVDGTETSDPVGAGFYFYHTAYAGTNVHWPVPVLQLHSDRYAWLSGLFWDKLLLEDKRHSVNRKQ